jgi:hypothetical protein
LVAFARHLIPAALVYKFATSALDGFGWRGGMAGMASGDAITRLPLPRHEPLAAVVPESACPIIALSGGDDGAMICAAIASGVKGIVLMALGRGNGSVGAAKAVEQAVAAGIPVVVASRCPTGSTAADYASGQRLADAGAIFAGGLARLRRASCSPPCWHRAPRMWPSNLPHAALFIRKHIDHADPPNRHDGRSGKSARVDGAGHRQSSGRLSAPPKFRRAAM